MKNQGEWYLIDNINDVDSPALVIYPDRVKENIRRVVNSIDDVSRLRPHVKTHKSAEVTRLMLDAGITKFKCATIAEAEMLLNAGATDILLAYQPVGPKINRLLELYLIHRKARISCLIDDFDTASDISKIFSAQSASIGVYIDLNIGMNRTGISTDQALRLYEECKPLKGIIIKGLHAYDGHIRDADFITRQKRSDEAFEPVMKLKDVIKTTHAHDLTIIAGGTPTFSVHCKRKDIECSPGTYIYWDRGYEQTLKEQHYLFAALVVTRVISKPTSDTICLDLGHKAIASENPIMNRVFFLNAPDLIPTAHSEEHMVFKISNNASFKVGDVLYGVPYHICPTVALHDRVAVVEGNKVTSYWATIARNRKISI